MALIQSIQQWFSQLQLPVLLILGSLTFVGLFTGKSLRFLRLPSILGYMLIGVLAGPSLAGILGDELVESLSFIPEIALGFVALSIGLELHFPSLKREGKGIVLIIIAESIIAFAVTTGGVYLLTGNLPMALVFGAIAPASAPAGTVAVIQEYRAKGPLTRALYSVVGFDDGFGIIIFGFASAFAASLLGAGSGEGAGGFLTLIGEPFGEIGLSLGVGAILSLIFILCARPLESGREVFILIFSIVLAAVGIAQVFHLSSILINMVIGISLVNTQKRGMTEKVRDEIGRVLPLLFVLFFVIAGANLHISALPSLGLIGLVYIVCRSAGLIGGSWLGARISKVEEIIRKYLGIGILSQAGVAIGLALTVSTEFPAYGEAGAYIGRTVITTITASSIFFEIVGPLLTKLGLKKAGEINVD